MKFMIQNVLSDDQGTETVEYAFILGMVIVAAMGVLGVFGSKVFAKWTVHNGTGH